VRPLADGSYAFLGRRDHMVKSRGYRIELGEIEQALYSHPGVREAVVVPIPDPEIGSRLHAVVTSNPDASVSADQLRAHCTGRLPRYMVPEDFALSRTDLPRTSTGKIDRIAVTKSLANMETGLS
jgi:acyl-coenzyme A synthetase/AMP-(fatty) acid ligase